MSGNAAGLMVYAVGLGQHKRLGVIRSYCMSLVMTFAVGTKGHWSFGVRHDRRRSF
jgi:hypothetical protein